MNIEYETRKFVDEKRQFNIEDSKNVFLKGINPYDNLPTYFGIWENDNKLSIVSIISYRNIKYGCYLNTNLSTESDIKEYLRYNDNVKIITKDEFKEQIQKINSILRI